MNEKTAAIVLALLALTASSNSKPSPLAAEVDRVVHPNSHNRGGVFLGTAYDIIRGNPHGNDLNSGGLDPGVKRTVNIFKTTNVANPLSDCPDQANCVPVGAVCSQTVEESLILDGRDYQNSFSSSLNFEATVVDQNMVSHTGGISLGLQRAVDLLEKEEKSIIFRKAVCLLGESSFKSDRDLLVVELDSYFVDSLCRLLINHSDSDLLRFFNHWGTHAITHLFVGTKEYEHTEVEKVELMRAFQTDYSASIFYEAGIFKLFTARVTPSAKYSATRRVKEFHTFSKSFNFTAGTEEFPEPISMRLKSLLTVLDEKYVSAENLQVCPQIGQPENLEILRTAVTHGLNEYPKWVGAEKNLTALIRQIPAMTTWPAGVYGFLKTTSDCPAGWSAGRRFHDTKNAGTPDNTWSAMFFNRTSSVVFPNDLILEFCMKEEDPIAAQKKIEWPPGSYCMYKSKKGPCPYGFGVGSYYHDDDDFYNANYLSGQVPDGSYGKNTEYKFCCRDDASPFKPIFLPLERDFILMPKRGTCQEVFGMKAEKHWIRMDCEDHWYSGCTLSGDAPYGNRFEDNDYELFFCAYSKM